MKTRYLSGSGRDREGSIKGYASAGEDFMSLGLGKIVNPELHIQLGVRMLKIPQCYNIGNIFTCFQGKLCWVNETVFQYVFIITKSLLTLELRYLITIPDLFVGICCQCCCQNCFAIRSHGFVTSIN